MNKITIIIYKIQDLYDTITIYATDWLNKINKLIVDCILLSVNTNFAGEGCWDLFLLSSRIRKPHS